MTSNNVPGSLGTGVEAGKGHLVVIFFTLMTPQSNS
jgi:hypothetical protein